MQLMRRALVTTVKRNFGLILTASLKLMPGCSARSLRQVDHIEEVRKACFSTRLASQLLAREVIDRRWLETPARAAFVRGTTGFATLKESFLTDHYIRCRQCA